MPRFHAAFGMLSPAKTSGVKATRHNSNSPADMKRAEIFTRSSDLGSFTRLWRKTIFYIRVLRIQVRDGNMIPNCLAVSNCFIIRRAWVAVGKKFDNRNHAKNCLNSFTRKEGNASRFDFPLNP